MKFIILGNDNLPVGTREERENAAAAMRKAGLLRAPVYEGSYVPGVYTLCDETGRVLQCNGVLR